MLDRETCTLITKQNRDLMRDWVFEGTWSLFYVTGNSEEFPVT